jgi:4-diphosphocytidyl-2-C-methyl-D-erythritol kinase
MICFPNGKINLGLSVTARRPDGYHNLETVFYPVKLCDILEVVRADHFSFQQTGLVMEIPVEENLVVKAFRLLEKCGDLPPVKIHLHKVIPTGAGLGGGSSDAAFLLKMVNEWFEAGYSKEQLEEMAGTLGADCPFFIGNTPALATGTGHLLHPIPVNLTAYYLVLVKPSLSVSTAMAYRSIIPRIPDIHVSEVISRPVETWRGSLVNDFEEPVFAMFPELRGIRDELYRLGAVYASMSGSGSALYGFFRELPPGITNHFPDSSFIYIWDPHTSM